jgi:hypothetical protein
VVHSMGDVLERLRAVAWRGGGDKLWGPS